VSAEAPVTAILQDVIRIIEQPDTVSESQRRSVAARARELLGEPGVAAASYASDEGTVKGSIYLTFSLLGHLSDESLARVVVDHIVPQLRRQQRAAGKSAS
jgi:hypothetical protein